MLRHGGGQLIHSVTVLLAAGQSIGNYRILNKIGTGGMGAVYLAEHPLIGKRVALKVIHRELAGNREVVSRFFQEARAVNKIGNEHIVEIHDFGVTPEGDHFYIMEYLDGRTLASVLAREKPLEVMRSLHIGAQIANALASAHAAGIVHRDLKPDNIMLMARLGDQDFVKVLDFGLAKVFSAASAVKTAAGVLLGTPQYMSPEACESKRDIDHRTDIYALGVLLFQMMTGELPFDGDTMGEVLVKQVTMLPPAPRATNPAIPPSVEQVLLRCLAKPVDARFATMRQLREALLDPEAYLRGSPPIAPARAVTSAFAVGEASAQAMQVASDAAAPPPGAAWFATGALPPAAMAAMSAPAGAPTLIAGQPPARRASNAMPALMQPQEPKNNTMRIATPAGYSSRPRRRVWPLVVGIAVVLGVGGGVLSVTCFGRDGAAPRGGEPRLAQGSEDSVAPGPAGSAGSTGAGVATGGARGRTASGDASDTASTGDAGGANSARGADSAGGANGAGISPSVGSRAMAAGSGSGAAPAVATGGPLAGKRMAHLVIESVPVGAAVTGPSGAALGKTPLTLAWPTSAAPVSFELRLSGFKTKRKQTVVSGNSRLVIELEPVRRNGQGARPPGQGGKNGGIDNGLMRPD